VAVLRQRARTRHPLQGKAAISRIVAAKLDGSLNEEEWRELVRSLIPQPTDRANFLTVSPSVFFVSTSHGKVLDKKATWTAAAPPSQGQKQQQRSLRRRPNQQNPSRHRGPARGTVRTSLFLQVPPSLFPSFPSCLNSAVQRFSPPHPKTLLRHLLDKQLSILRPFVTIFKDSDRCMLPPARCLPRVLCLKQCVCSESTGIVDERQFTQVVRMTDHSKTDGSCVATCFPI
jgi:hypothetical protein